MIFKTAKKLLAGLVPLLMCLPTTASAQRVADGPQLKKGSVESCSTQLRCEVGERRSYDYSAVFVSEADIETNTQTGSGSFFRQTAFAPDT